jgi:carbamate kinase
MEAIRALLDLDIVVICTGGGGIPTLVTRTDGRATLTGVEAVIDKDFATELLAREIDADVFVMATDVDGVYADWGTPGQRRLDEVTVAELLDMQFPAGSMGPKVEAAASFAAATGKRAAIGSLADIEQIVEGKAGTQVLAG